MLFSSLLSGVVRLYICRRMLEIMFNVGMILLRVSPDLFLICKYVRSILLMFVVLVVSKGFETTNSSRPKSGSRKTCFVLKCYCWLGLIVCLYLLLVLGI